jgi:arylsulfatase A-like enzyme
MLALLRSLDKIKYAPAPRDFLKRPPTWALHVLTDGITPRAMELANTPNLDALAKRGARATRASGIFPTITGPSHTSMLTGARVGTHGFLYPKMLDAYGNRLLEFSEGLMRAETIAEAWRPRGITTAGIGSRFLRGADMMQTEGVYGEDYIEITHQAITAINEWQPHYLHVVYYFGDSAGHLYGPEADETLFAIGQMDEMVGRLLNAYADKNMDGELVVLVNADHGMIQIQELVPSTFAADAGALAHGRVALSPRGFDDATFEALMNDARVDDIFARDELDLLGAYGPRWGEHVLQLREGWMFDSATGLSGYHGAWTDTDRRIPFLLSGAGIRSGAELDVCELVDAAPTLSCLMGGAMPENNQGRVLWEALETVDEAPGVSNYTDLLLQRDAALVELKELKRERAGGAMYRSDYDAQRAEILLRARMNLAAMEEERKQLGFGE